MARLEKRLEHPGWNWKANGTAAADYSKAFTEFLDEMVKVVQLDSRLLQHTIVALWVKNAQRFGWRTFLKRLPGDLEKGVKRPVPAKDTVLFAEVERLQWGEQVTEPLEPEVVSLDQQLKALRERRRPQVPPEIRMARPTATSPHPLGISMTRPPSPRSLAAIQHILAQRVAVRSWAREHGYEIVREFADDASGLDTQRRHEFLALLQLCAEPRLRQADVVLCYDVSRFSRLEPDEAAYYEHSFRRAWGPGALHP